VNRKWRAWVDENLRKKCNPDEILSILLENKIPVAEIKEAMGKSFPEGSPRLKDTPPVGTLGYVIKDL